MPAPKEFKLFAMRNFRPIPGEIPPALPTEILDTEFKKRYPPDPQLGHELDDNARVWKIYRDEAIQHDDGLLQAWNNTVNILLTFAGLFSAAVTAFVIESYQFLQPGPVDVGSALYALAVNNTATLHSLSTSPTHPSSAARIINGLWFTSLFFSLAAAFLCILVKQWLDEYIARTRASSQNPKHWSRRRAFYFRGLDDWGVEGIISVLPVLLHVSLFLFFAGMVVLLWSLSRALAAWLSGIGGGLLLLYATSLLLPFWKSACPFATPLVKQVRRSSILLRIAVLERIATMALSSSIQWCLAQVLHLRSIYMRYTISSPPDHSIDLDNGRHPPFAPATSVHRDSPTTITMASRCSLEAQRLHEQLGRSAFDQALSKSAPLPIYKYRKGVGVR